MSQKRLQGKVAIVTGGGTGLGRSITLAFAEEGADVVVVARNSSEIEAVAKEASAFKGKALPVRADVSKKRDVEEMVKKTLSQFGRIDILMNNAGVGGPTDFVTEIKEEDWDSTIDTNLKGVFLCVQGVVPQMMKQKGGNIINMSSGSGTRKKEDSFLSPTRSLVYNVSKAAVEMLTIALAVQLNPFNINVNALRPGPTDTRIHLKTPAEKRAKMRKPDDIKKVAVFLASQGPMGITGESIDAASWEKTYFNRTS
ncbi:MAG: SDR family NAD(P)-dependent oxidoreductase [Thermodesulfobacteriota bacterium]